MFNLPVVEYNKFRHWAEKLLEREITAKEQFHAIKMLGHAYTNPEVIEITYVRARAQKGSMHKDPGYLMSGLVTRYIQEVWGRSKYSIPVPKITLYNK